MLVFVQANSAPLAERRCSAQHDPRHLNRRTRRLGESASTALLLAHGSSALAQRSKLVLTQREEIPTLCGRFRPPAREVSGRGTRLLLRDQVAAQPAITVDLSS